MGTFDYMFKLFRNFVIASFKIAGYTMIFIVQIILHMYHRRKDKISDDFGFFGRGVIDAIGDIFKD